MFTGIVQGMGTLRELRDQSSGKRLVLDRDGWKPSGGAALSPGDSVCVSGVCLTVVEFDDRVIHFDVIRETLAKSRLGSLRVGDKVNLESCLTPTTPMGGHFVQGHVDGVGTITRIDAGAEEWRVTVAPPPGLMEYMTPKGSVCLDGISLTLASVNREHIEVALIPTTLKLTTLGNAKVGDPINIEADVIAKTIVHWLRYRQQGDGLTMGTLRSAGFL